ncbi:MAG: hypothetical protein ACPGVT_07045 [Maricaulaceae bacterium]
MRIMSIILLLISGLANSVTSYSQATDTSPLNIIYECAEITSNDHRLSCYDKATQDLRLKEKTKEIVTIDANAANTIKREAFGFSLPSLPKLGLPSLGKNNNSKDNKEDSVEYAVRSISKSRRGIIITMENGQVWRGVNGNLNYIPKGKLTAQIKSGAMGSYRLNLTNGKERVRGLGVRRTE